MGTISTGPLTASTVIARLKGQNGVHEDPRNSNRQKFGVWYGWNGVPWCAIFECWGFRDSLRQIGGKTAGVWTLSERFRVQGRRGTTPRVGALAIFREHKHTGMVISIPDSTYVWLVEGNTSKADGTNYWGGNVAIKKRRRSDIIYYCYPMYAGSSTTTTTGLLAYPGHAHHAGYRDDWHVARIQARLKALGHSVAVDGDFGNGTKAAVIAFQGKNGLTRDGIVGPNTWSKLRIPA